MTNVLGAADMLENTYFDQSKATLGEPDGLPLRLEVYVLRTLLR
jgi:hypothetical protein